MAIVAARWCWPSTDFDGDHRISHFGKHRDTDDTEQARQCFDQPKIAILSLAIGFDLSVRFGLQAT